MNKTELNKIQRQGHFDIGRLLTESELRELAYLKTGSTQFTWGDILNYASIHALNYSVDFLKEAQYQYAKEYVAEHHTSKAKGLATANKITQSCLLSIISNTIAKSTFNNRVKLMKQLQRGGYFKFFE